MSIEWAVHWPTPRRRSVVAAGKAQAWRLTLTQAGVTTTPMCSATVLLSTIWSELNVSSLSHQCLTSSTFSNNTPSTPNMNRAARTMPANLPSMNWRRETGLLITVMAVRPSISSLIDRLAVSAPNRTAASMIVS